MGSFVEEQRPSQVRRDQLDVGDRLRVTSTKHYVFLPSLFGDRTAQEDANDLALQLVDAYEEKGILTEPRSARGTNLEHTFDHELEVELLVIGFRPDTLEMRAAGFKLYATLFVATLAILASVYYVYEGSKIALKKAEPDSVLGRITETAKELGEDAKVIAIVLGIVALLWFLGSGRTVIPA